MKPTHWLVGVLVVMVLGFVLIPHVAAEEFPSKQVQLVIPFGAGGSHDLHARALVAVAREYLGQPLVPVLMPGAGGVIASAFVANQEPDGYTLLFGGTGPNTVLPIVQD